MTRLNARRRRAQRNQPAAQVHVPHWSWARKDAPPQDHATLAPDEFWSRLGL
ncbi:MAG: hypothetical protein ABW039_13410 [Sphingobium sp.]